MDNVWFTSDLHIGHTTAARLRGFDSIEEHDEVIINNIASMLNKKSKLFVLGDVAWKKEHLARIAEIPGTKDLIIGNHDKLRTEEYLKYFNNVHGVRTYKNFWLSHCPIHPQEIFRCKGNIHGHIHRGGATGDLYLPYLNVNVDVHNFHPVNFDTIKEIYNIHPEVRT